MMIKAGQKVCFRPFKEFTGFAADDIRQKIVTGTVVCVYEQNQWFSVEYDCGGVDQRISFKFCQIGKDVLICG